MEPVSRKSFPFGSPERKTIIDVAASATSSKPISQSGRCCPVMALVIRKKENRLEAADYGRSNLRNQRRIDFLRSTATAIFLSFAKLSSGN